MIMPTISTAARTFYITDKPGGDRQGPPLLLIHGAGGSRLDWPAELRRLPGPRVITIDLPGHGRSPGTGRADTQDYARDVAALMDALSIERAIWCGHSMGGAVALQAALTTPERVAGLVLVATGSKLPVDPALPERALHDREQTARWIVDTAWGDGAPQELKAIGLRRLLETSPGVLHDDFLACRAFDVRDRLGAIGAPTLVIGARDDRMVKLKFSETLAERIPNATLVIVESAGHMVLLEHAQALSRVVGQWVAERTW